MLTLHTIEQLADFGQTVLNKFVGVVLVMGVRVVPNSFTAPNSVACLVPAAEASTEEEFEYHTMVEGHGVIFQMTFSNFNTPLELVVVVESIAPVVSSGP